MMPMYLHCLTPFTEKVRGKVVLGDREGAHFFIMLHLNHGYLEIMKVPASGIMADSRRETISKSGSVLMSDFLVMT